MTEQHAPHAAPLDLEKIELFARKNYFDAASVASQDVLTLVAEVRALRAEVDEIVRYRGTAVTVFDDLRAGQERLRRDLAAVTQERDEARRDLAAARAALERLLTYFDQEPCVGEADGVCGMHGFPAPCAVAVARAALGPEGVA